MQPTMNVTDYRTTTTGIEPAHLDPCAFICSPYIRRIRTLPYHLFASYNFCYIAKARIFADVQAQVARLIKDKILVGYALWTDLSGTFNVYFPFHCKISNNPWLTNLP